MSLPYSVAPATGAGEVLTGGATGTDENEDTQAERTKPSVTAMVLSRPGLLVDASSTRGTHPVCFMTVTTPTVHEGVAANFRKALQNS
jgi:hypothetical protein